MAAPKIVPDYADSSAFKPRPDVRSRTIASLYTIGGFFVIVAVMIGTIYIMDLCGVVVNDASGAHDMEDAGPFIMTLVILLLFGNGITYLLCAAKIRRNVRPAVLVALILATIHFGATLMGLLAFLVYVIELLTGYMNPIDAILVMIVGLFMGLLAVVALRLVNGLMQMR